MCIRDSLWAADVAAGNKFFECTRTRPLDQFARLAAGDLFIVARKGTGLSIAAVAEVASAAGRGVADRGVLYAMLPPVRRRALDAYLGAADAFDFVPFSRAWDLTQAGLTVHGVAVRIGVAEPEKRRRWDFGLVDISAESEVHQCLLDLLAQYPCRSSGLSGPGSAL